MTGRLYKPSPHGEGGPRQRRAGAFVSSTNAPLFLLYYHLSFIPCLPYPPLFLPPSFGRREKKGRRLAARNGTPTFGEANPASLRSSAPSRGRGANDFSGNTDSIVVFRGLGLTLPPHVPRTSPLSSSVFQAACALSAPAGHLPLEGKATIQEYPLLKRRRSRHESPEV